MNCLDIHARRNVEHKFLFFSGRSVTRAIVNGPMVEASTANDLEFTGSRADGFDNWAMEVEGPIQSEHHSPALPLLRSKYLHDLRFFPILRHLEHFDGHEFMAII